MKNQIYLKCAVALFLMFFSCLTVIHGQVPVTFPSGSYIVNMGLHANVRTTDIARELKPYGMVYDLLKNYNVPVYVVINPTKVKDGPDFVYNGVVYRGGTFVIDKRYITPTVTSRIAFWNTQGVVGDFTNSSLSLNTTYKINAVPNWTLDAQNGAIATGFFANAGIPVTAYNYLAPSQLGVCSDIFVMPHADPVWSTHGNLYNWNLQYKGAIWLGCHAGSALENMYNPANTSEQTNFLSNKATTAGSGIILPAPGSTSYSQNSLILWGNHNDATIPYNTLTGTVASGTLATPADPVAQYIGVTDLAHLNGSEQVYLPVSGQGWRSSTQIITYDATQADVPALSAGPAAIIAYGRGFGDPTRGFVMMEAGHSINKGTLGDVAAQRAFFNWSYLAMRDKAMIINNLTGIPANGEIYSSTPLNITVDYTLQVPASNLTFTWSCVRADNGLPFGSFTPNGNTAAATTVFTPGAVTDPLQVNITVKIKDACGRESFESNTVTVKPAPRPPVAQNDVAFISTSCYAAGISTTVNVLANDSDPDGDPLTVTSVSGTNGTWTTNGTTVTFAPTSNFFGVATATYTVCDNTPLATPNPPFGGPKCTTATITVNVGTPDANGCYPGSILGVTALQNTGAQTNSSVTNAANALGNPDYDPADNTSYAVIDNNGDILTLDFGSVLSATAFDSVAVYFASQSQGTSVTGSFSASIDGTTFSALGTRATTSNDPGDEFRFRVPASGIRYLRVQRSAGSPQLWFDAAQLEKYGCVAAVVSANNDAATAVEDIETIIKVVDNDVNPGDLPLSVTVLSNPTNGLVSVNPDNTISYITTGNFPSGGNGTDSFTYRICNTKGNCSSATVNITVSDDGCANGQYKPFVAGGTTTVTIQGTNTNMIDSWVKKDRPTENRATSNPMEIGKNANERRGIFLFNGNPGTIPSNAVIQSAVFSIYRSGGDGNDLTLSAHPVTETWTEAGVTWNSRNGTNNWTAPGISFDPTAAATITSTGTNGYKDFNITSLVQGWVSGSVVNNGIVVRQSASPLVDKRHQFQQSEGTANQTPKLVITYDVPAPCAAIPDRKPMANPDQANTNTGIPVAISPLVNDGDPDGSSLSISAVTNAVPVSVAPGTISFNGSSITYTPNGSRPVPRTDTLLYTLSSGGLNDQAYVFVRVGVGNPEVNRDNSSDSSGVAQTVNLGTNDVDPQGLTLSNPVVTVEPQDGSYTLSGTSITYTPNPGFYGIDTLVYQRCQAAAGGCNDSPLCDTALVVFNVINRPPLAQNLVESTVICQPVNFSLSASISDPENENTTVSIVSGPANGSLALNTDGTYTYTPNAGFPSVPSVVNDTIRYQVSDPTGLNSSIAFIIIGVSGTPINNAPVAVDDLYDTLTFSGTGILNQDLYVDVKPNDSDPDGDFLGIQLSAFPGGPALIQPANGTISVFNGRILYIPDFNFTGVDTFEYVLYDSLPLPTDPACPAHVRKYDIGLVTVYIAPLPPLDPIKIFGNVWNDVNNSAGNTFNNIFSAGESGTDAGNTLFVYCLDSAGKVIDIAEVNADGSYTLANVPQNSSIKLLLTSTPAVLGDSAVAETLPLGWVNTSPSNTGYFNSGVLYIDGQDWGVEELPVAVANSPAAPVQNPEGFNNYTLPPASFGGTDPSGGFITSLTLTTYPAGANSITINGTVYTNGGVCPPATTCQTWPGSVVVPTDSSGAPTQPVLIDPVDNDVTVCLPFLVTDNAGKQSLNTDTVCVAFVDDEPIAVDDQVTTNEDTPVNINVCANDTSSVDGVNTWSSITQPANGTITFTAPCTFTYTPDPDYNGTDSFQYIVCDVDGDCDTAVVNITINPVDDFPIAEDDTASTTENTPVTINICDNDTLSADGGNTFTTINGPSSGLLTFSPVCSFTYTPNPGFSGTDTIKYILCDIDGDCDTALIIINVTCTTPAAPVASVTQPDCSTGVGSISITSPLRTDYTYSIDGVNYQAGTSFSGLATGTYTLTVKNDDCISPGTAVVINAQPGTPAAPTVSITQPTCATATGTISISAPTGAGMTYSINGSTYQSSATFSGLAAGTYSVTAKNSDGCISAPTSATVNAQPTTPAAPTVSITQPTCATATGAISISAPTGAGMTYSINGSTYQSSTTFSGLAAGTYSVTAKNSDGCISAPTSATVNAQPATPPAPTVSITQPTCAVATATISISAPTGTGMTYSINGSTYQSSATFSGLAAGTYSVTAKNSDGCISAPTSATVNAQPATPPAPTVSITQPTCAVATGTISISAPTGTGMTYSINGSTYQSSTTFSGLAAGTYSVTAKNSDGCISAPTSATVNAQPATPPAPTVSITQPTCAVATGTISISAPSGAGMTYSINGSTYQSSATFSGLAAGTYSFTAKNSAGCVSAPTSATVNAQPSAPPAPTVSITQPTCAVATGTISISAPTGAGMTYSINGSTYQSSTTFSGVVAGTYSVTARNSAGCVSAPTSVTVNVQPATPPAPTVSVIQPTCSVSTGSITITSPTGTGIAYNINGGTFQSTTTFNALSPGTYLVRARNAAGCVSNATSVTLVAATNCNSAGLFPTATTCASFKSGATPITEVCYSTRSNTVSNVTPGVFFYYTYVTAPSTSFTVDVLQSSLTAGFRLFGVQVSSNQAQVFLWNPNCAKVATGSQPSLGQARVTINNAVPGQVYVLSVKYDTKSVIGSLTGSPAQIANYSFRTVVNSITLPGTTVGLLAKPSNCFSYRSALDEGVNPALTAFPNPTSGDLNLVYEMQDAGDAVYTLYDITGSLVLEGREQHDSAGEYQILLPLAEKNLAPAVYFLRLVRNEHADVLRILINK